MAQRSAPSKTNNDLRARALEDLWVFANEVMGMDLQERPHREMVDYLQDPYQPNKMMLVPRDCLKTTIGSTLYPLWMVLRAHFLEGNPCYRVMIDSATVRLSKFVISNIRSWVRYHQGLISTFGELYDRKGDSQEGFSLVFRVRAATGVKEPNFIASGVGAEKTGLHADLIVLDDLVTKDNVRTIPMREKVWEHYRMLQAILESDASGQKSRVVVVGTRYGDDDMYGRIILQDKERIAQEQEPRYAPMIRAAIDDEGELFYPTKLTKEVLADRRSAMGGLFWAQYMNDPNKESAPFKEDQLRWHSLSNFPALRWIRISVDPAYKEEEVDHGDHTAIVVAGWDKFSQMWILDVHLRRDLTPGAFIDLFLHCAQRWQVDSAIIESDHQEAMQLLMQRECQQRGIKLPIIWEKKARFRGKENRWLDVQAYAERKAIKIADEIPADTKLEIMDEWTRAPFARFDDFLDAVQLQTLHLPVAIGERLQEFDGKTVPEISEAAVRTNAGPFWGTLSDRFPMITALKQRPDQEIDYNLIVDEQYVSALNRTFGEGVGEENSI